MNRRKILLYFGGAIITAIISFFINKLLEGLIWAKTVIFVKWIWSFLTYSINIQLWLFCLLLLPAVKLIISFYKDSARPGFHNYTEDNILGIKWKWDWNGNKIGYYQIHGFCPNCENQLSFDRPQVTKYSNTTFICDKCEKRFIFDHDVPWAKSNWEGSSSISESAIIDKVRKEIARRVNSGEYKK